MDLGGAAQVGFRQRCGWDHRKDVAAGLLREFNETDIILGQFGRNQLRQICKRPVYFRRGLFHWSASSRQAGKAPLAWTAALL